MNEDMIEDMTLTEGETTRQQNDFLDNLDKRKKVFKAEEAKTGKKGEFYYVVRGAIWDTFKWRIIYNAILAFLADCMAIGYTTFLIVFIKHIKDPESTITQGCWKLAIYIVLIICFSTLKNMQIFHGMYVATQLRKTIILSMYTKVTRLSVKSLTETNSGKLITIVSGDIQAIERQLGLVPSVFTAPFINIIAYVVIGLTSGWEFSAITFCIWIVIMVCQHYSSKKLKDIKMKESKFSDERQKLVNDMVVGARTIKSYGWENHYLTKIVKTRANQAYFVFVYGIIGSLGLSIF